MNGVVRRGLHLGIGLSAAACGISAVSSSSAEILSAKGGEILPHEITEHFPDGVDIATERTIAVVRGIGGIAAAAYAPDTQPMGPEGIAYRNFAIGALMIMGVAAPSMNITFRR